MIRCIISIFMGLTLISCQTTSRKVCSPISKEDLSIKIYGKSLSELRGFNPTFKQGRENGQIDPYTTISNSLGMHLTEKARIRSYKLGIAPINDSKIFPFKL